MGGVSFLGCHGASLKGLRCDSKLVFQHCATEDTGCQGDQDYMKLRADFADDLDATLPALGATVLAVLTATAAVLQGLSDFLAQARHRPDVVVVQLTFD
ncbi:MAG: hypothetical protein ACK559_29350, partial [bacterium]